MTLSLLLGLIGAGIAGALGHEVAHWAVWKCTGRRPTIDWWGLTAIPRAGPKETTPGDRVAAAAPYIFGLVAVVSGVLWFGVFWIVFGLSMIQIPSRVDLAAMLGKVEWRLAPTS